MLWLCECQCENKTHKTIYGHNLVNGKSKSCGCINKESIKNIGYNNKKYNTYNLSGEFGIGYTLKGQEFYFDLEDYNKIKDYCWSINNRGYLEARNKLTNKSLFMHNLVINIFGIIP